MGPIVVSKDTSIIIRDPDYLKFTTEDLVQFTSSDVALLEVSFGQDGSQPQRMTSIISIHGTPLPAQELSLSVVSLLSTENAHGCSCPAIFNNEMPNATAVVVYRGSCTFYEKAINAVGAARLVIVVDQAVGPQEAVRPVLVDAVGQPMSPDAAYPSLVMVQGQTRATYLQQGKTVKVKVNKMNKDMERLLIRGDQIENVEVSVET